jgi:hypothetical protein
LYLESEGDSDAYNEEKKGHHKVRQRASIPWGVVNTWIHSPSIVYQYHQLRTH